ncbi:hypothetical protein [Frigoribacterium faeni]|uniref:Uncharacterized protein n=2 Tax=Frigoribacterium faeni TaxID=145483 RepID=A0A7W3JH83_9MICO|nr:hypothetical protein [Frigoribacterium faeni]MBA8812872.1 hypothetical protein [Frigoribacterium faeni]GEK82500.1 hypothetical protein FFA01_08090 [Frigoribacterium faeni]
MPVGPSHPSCFVFERRLFVVPSGTGHGVVETRQSMRGSRVGSRETTVPGGIDVWLLVGGITGGLFLATVAGAVWGVGPVLSLVLFFAMGALVGAVLATGTRSLFVPATASAAHHDGSRGGAAFPAVEVPWDVARAAPDDATADELVLWSTLVTRYRRAEEARVETPGEPATPTPIADEPAPASVEAEYRAAVRDYEPVARLLGFRLP